MGFAAAAALLIAAGPAHAAGFWDRLVQNDGKGTEAEAGELSARIASGMSDEELLGQVCLFGYVDTEPSPSIMRFIQEKRIGGVKIFTRNVADLDSLAAGIARMQAASQASGARVPLLVATDQEGGWVRHIKLQTSVTAGNLAIGASRLPLDSYLTGYYLGRELAALGINMNFAPTVDVYANPDATVIGPRSFGSDPQETGLLSAAYVQGMRKAGVLCTAKHFPGHGSADQDSHGRLPVIQASLETLRARDLIPYRILAREGVPAIMSAHLAFPRILGDLTPSSLSPFFLQKVLREEIGFSGIIITDDMEMEGVLAGGIDSSTACRLALEAGNDMVLISHSPPTEEKTWQVLLAEMKRNPAFHERIAESARRVIRTKIEFFRGIGKNGQPRDVFAASTLAAAGRAALGGGGESRAASGAPAGAGSTSGTTPAGAAGSAGRPAVPASAILSLPAGPLQIPAAGAAAFFFQSSCRSVSVEAAGGIPFTAAAAQGGQAGRPARILLCGQFEEFIQEGSLKFPRADTLLFSFSPFYTANPGDLTRIPAAAAKYDAVIFCLANFNSLEILKRLKGMKDKVLVISALTPVYLREVPWVETAVAVYGSGHDSFRAGFAALTGDYAPKAVMPVQFEPPAAEQSGGAAGAPAQNAAAAPQTRR